MPGFDNYQAGLAGTFADAVLLSLAMSLKIRQILNENQLLSSQLEVEVENRTKELADATLRLEVANTELKKLAESDPLTGLANRRSMDRVLKQEFDRFLRRKRPFTLLVIDLDDFKTVNDRYGHEVGDKVLKVAAGLMESVLRNEDQVFRLGGEEFCLLALDTDKEQAMALAERVRQTMDHSEIEINGDHIRMTASIGGATFHEHMAIEDLFRVADEAMYRAKHSGKNRVEFHH
jgi:diguanylate cyclase (GGDEF)-like protein